MKSALSDATQRARRPSRIGSVKTPPFSDWIGAGINLNAIAPGMIETAMTAEGLADPIIGPHIKNLAIPANRPGKPEEIAEFLTFLLGPQSSILRRFNSLL